MEMSFQHYLLGLFAVANNLPAIPLYLSIASELTRAERNRFCFTVTLTAFITMALAMMAGSLILNFFEISISAFRIAGGILLVISGLNMENSKVSLTATHDKQSFSEIISVAVIPIGIPLTTGAGTISTVILFAGATHHSPALLIKLGAAIIAMTLIIYISFRYSLYVLKYLGHNGMNVLTKVFGLITLALGIQFILMGLSTSFPGLLK
ncbi:MAG: NAAT family transporter [Proteobacteria bacterium]|nr:NAAT family transporter [Pseudomonadota bacterium]